MKLHEQDPPPPAEVAFVSAQDQNPATEYADYVTKKIFI